MILVTGATGQYGHQAIEHLLAKGIAPSGIVSLVRDAAKAERLKEMGIQVRVADYTDPRSLGPALKDVQKVLLVSSNDRGAIENRTAQHINVITAAKNAGVEHLVYTSFLRKPDFEGSAIADFQNSHLQSENFLKQSGIPYTTLQNGIYLEMIPVFAGANVASSGTILFPAAEGRASYVLRTELAEAAAFVLTTGGHLNKTYCLTNTASVSFRDISAEISSAIGRPVTYQSASVEDFRSVMERAGMPDLYIGMFTMWSQAIAQGTLDEEDKTLAVFLGRQPTSMKTFVHQVYG